MDRMAIFGCFIAVVVPIVLKLLTTSTQYPNIFKRPDGAMDCNLFNTGGQCDHESGFPSGHVTLITYFCLYIYRKYGNDMESYLFGKEKDVQNKCMVLFLCIIPVLMMGYARYMKSCHNIIQIVAGGIIGYFISKYVHFEPNTR